MGNGVRVVTALNRKGGCGKTTLIMGLASAAAARGETVTIFDTDESKSTFKWMQRAKAAGNWNPLVNVVPSLSASSIVEEIDHIHEQPDQEHLILQDTFGGGSEAQDLLVLKSHILVAPCMLSANNYEETLETALWYLRLKKRVDDPGEVPPFKVLINRMALRRSASEEGVYVELLNRMPVLDEIVMNRAMYGRMDSDGLLGEIRKNTTNAGIVDYLTTALGEMDDVLKEIDSAIKEAE